MTTDKLPQRVQKLLTYADTSQKGIEIAPYFNPTLRKSDGYDILAVDVFDTDRLLENARSDPNIPAQDLSRIEPVDLVGDAGALGELVAAQGLEGKISYIISSHNFEHLPNPIRFLQGVSKALKPGGVLSMAIPDHRVCFDHLRLPTKFSEWLTAYHTHSAQPTAAQQFEAGVNVARSRSNPEQEYVTRLDATIIPEPMLGGDIKGAYQAFLDELEAPGAYKDTHCTVTFPELFELYMRDLRYLGLIDLEVVEVMPSLGIEFFAHLRKTATPPPTDASAHRVVREKLLLSISGQMGRAGFFNAPRSRSELVQIWIKRRILGWIGADNVAAVKNWNSVRREARRSKQAAR